MRFNFSRFFKALGCFNVSTLVCSALFGLPISVSTAQDIPETLKTLVADGAKLQLLTSDCKFTEGPAADATGRVYFTDQPNNRIMVADLDGSVKTFMENAGHSNGMYFDSEWNLIACADEKNELWEIKSNGEHRVIFKAPASEALNGPNDLWINSEDVIYFTDPFYKRPWWDHQNQPREIRGLYQVQIDGTELKLLDGDFKQPNGIVGDSKNSLLYVADIGDTKIYVYPIKYDGSLGQRKLFCEDQSDGLTLDSEGNLYVTNKNGVTIYDRSGKSLGSIATGKSWTANVCFGGADNKTLFITASDSAFSLRMKVSGMR